MVDSGVVPLERLEADIIGWSGNLAAATARLLGWVADYDRREGWKAWGCRSTAHWLSWKCGESLHTAREKVRVARTLEDLPAIAESFGAGELSYSKVRAVTRVACAADDADWRDIARHATGAELDRIVAAVRKTLDRDHNADARRALERRHAHRCSRDDGLAEIRIVGPRDTVETIWAATEMVTGQLIDNAIKGSGRTRRDTIAERGGLAAVRHDAFERLAEQALAASPAAAERGDIGRLQLVVDTDLIASLAHDPDAVDPDAVDTDATVDPDGECTLGGSQIAPELALRWSCDIRASVMLEHDGHAHDEGRDTRRPNRRLRRALHRRDRGMCRFPGCGAATWLHAHHIVHWIRGGPTDLDNLVSLCGFHHHLVHEGGWSVAVVDDTIVWSDPDGIPATIEPLQGNASEVAATGVPAGTIGSTWHNDHLDFEFVIAVITDHCTRTRRRPRGDVPAGTPNSRLE